jgi:hypothetical protein
LLIVRPEAEALGIVRIEPGESERDESPQSRFLWFLGLSAALIAGLIWLSG